MKRRGKIGHVYIFFHVAFLFCLFVFLLLLSRCHLCLCDGRLGRVATRFQLPFVLFKKSVEFFPGKMKEMDYAAKMNRNLISLHLLFLKILFSHWSIFVEITMNNNELS